MEAKPVNYQIKWASGISYQEWVRRVSEVKSEEARSKVASIVFWDLFADRKSRGPHGLEPYLQSRGVGNSWDRVEPSLVAEALVSVGYPSDVAAKRVAPVNHRSGGNVVQFVQEKQDGDLLVESSCGAEGVMYAVATQAVEDMKTLVRNGVIVNGKVAKGWPVPGGNGVSGYKHRLEVEELIRFVSSGTMVKFLDALGTKIDQDVLMDAVGMP